MDHQINKWLPYHVLWIYGIWTLRGLDGRGVFTQYLSPYEEELYVKIKDITLSSLLKI